MVKREKGEISSRLILELKQTVKDLREVQGWSDRRIRQHIKKYISDYRFISKEEREGLSKKKVK